MTHWPLPATLPAEERDALLAGGRRRRFERGATLFRQGDPADHLLLLESGHVATRVGSPAGDQTTLAVVGPGTVFGEPELGPGAAVRRVTATALQPGTTVTVSRARFDLVRARRPEIDRVRWASLADQQAALAEHLLAVVGQSARDRVVRRLAELADRFGPVVPLTQEDLAQLAATTRPTVNEILRELERSGVLRTGRGQIVVRPDALRPGAGAGRPELAAEVLRPTG